MPSASPPRRTASSWPRLGFVVICGLALGWRLLGITSTEVWRDEAITLLHARLSWWDLLTRLWVVEDTPPTSFLCFKFASLFTAGELGLRLWSVAAGVATVAVLMVVVRRVHPGAWWAAGLLAAFSPMPVHYSQELRAYSLVSLTVVCSLYAACRATQEPHRGAWCISAAVLAALAAHLHAVGLFVWPAVLTWAVCMTGFRRWRGWIIASLAWLVLAAPVIWFAVGWSDYHQRRPEWWAYSMPDAEEAVRLAGEFTGHEGIAQWERGRGSTRGAASSSGMWAAFVLERVLALAWAALAILALTDGQVRRPALAFMAAGLVYLGLLTASSALGVPSILTRTLVVGWWPWLAAAALGAWTVGRRRRVAGLVALVVIVAFNATFWAWRVRWGPNRRPASAAGAAWVLSALRPSDLLVIDEPWFDAQVVYRLGPYISADQIWTPSTPAFQGKPPVQVLRAKETDPGAMDRLVAELDRRAAGNEPYSVWIIRPWWAGPPRAGTPEGLVASRLVPTSQHGGREPYSLTITRYEPRPKLP